jgi:hypothetical protein
MLNRYGEVLAILRTGISLKTGVHTVPNFKWENTQSNERRKHTSPILKRENTQSSMKRENIIET